MPETRLEATLQELMELFAAPDTGAQYAANSTLWDAECPVCRLVTRSVERSLRVFFSEFVNDPRVREGFRRSQGFCSEHIPLLAASGDALAIAILYADLARLAGERWNETERGLRLFRRSVGTATAPCPACSAATESATRYTASLASGLEIPEVWAALETGPELCVVHVDQVLSQARPAPAARLRKLEATRVAALQAELEEIIRKNDYRFRGEAWGAEKDAWLRALRKITRSHS